MTDIWVHERMRECCRKRLAVLDEARKLLDGDGLFVSLAAKLGELSVPAAAAQLEGFRARGEVGEIEARVRKLCATACAEHGAEHAASGDRKEAELWGRAEEALGGGVHGADLAVAPAQATGVAAPQSAPALPWREGQVFAAAAPVSLPTPATLNKT